MRRTVVLGTEIDAVSLSEATDRALNEMQRRRSAYVVTPNAEMLLTARRDPALRAALRGAALSLCDGVGVQLAARILGDPIRERIPGVDFIRALLPHMDRAGGRVFLLGALPGVAERAARRLHEAFPALEIVGWQDGYYAPEEEPALVARINALSPELVIVCLGSPRQEIWMREHAAVLRVGLLAGLGGTLDLFAGRVRRAPRWMRRAGLEWLFRTMAEPRRIARAVRLPALLIAALQSRIGGKQRDG